MTKNPPVWPAFLLFAVSVLGIGAKHLPPDFDIRAWIPGISVSVPLDGAEVIFIHEETDSPIEDVLTKRELPNFVETHKCRGFTVADKDDPWSQDFLKAASVKWKLSPPILAAVDIQDGEVTKIRKVVPYKGTLEDLTR